ncbi:hypothetical protein LDENG_00088800 [Lucifuga dentata]|nr:hypothetical protein LDENG_00088800 [Lucifuga dentata]
MLNNKLYFTPALLLLMLSSPVWHVSQSLPVTGKGSMTDSCVFYAQSLLEKITDALTQNSTEQNSLFTGIDCTKQNVQLNMETGTASVCAPKESCLTSIGKDLLYYYELLAAQPDPQNFLSPTVLFSLRELMENCFAGSRPKDFPLKEVSAEHPNTYDERLKLCKVLKGFQVSTITINRVIGYISSGEHDK